MKKSDRIYALLVSAIMAMLIASGVLAYVFFHMLNEPPEPPPAPPAAAPGGVSIEQAVLAPVPVTPAGLRTPVGVLTREPIRDAGDGRQRKYDLKVPTSPAPPGVPPALPAATAAERRRAAEAFERLPLEFYETCEPYGGTFDFTAPGAGFDIALAPGRICLNLRRPEVEVPEGQTLNYRLPRNGEMQDVNACSLEANVNVCIDMLGIQAVTDPLWQEAVQRPRTNTIYACENFRRWHEQLSGPPRARPAAPAGRETPGGAAPGTPGTEAVPAPPARNGAHYLLGADARQWISDIPAYASVSYPDIYPGIDLTCYGDRGRLEYVFVVWPGANPDDIRFTFDGATATRLDEYGNLVLDLECGRIVQHAPRLYQIVDGAPRVLPGGYELHDGAVRFRVEDYDATRPVVVSPLLDYLSFLGGNDRDRAYAVAVDGQGFAYVCGESASPGFAADPAPPIASRRNTDIFVTKFRIADSTHVYTTFIGGGAEDRAFAIAADADGNAYLCGETLSADFPVTNAPYSVTSNGNWNAFAARVSPAGDALAFSALFGGSSDDRAYGIALDAATNVYVAGETASEDFPTRRRLQRRHGGGAWDGFVLCIDQRAGDLDFSTWFGGTGDDSVHALAVDPVGCLYLAGETSSRDLPLKNPLQPQFGGGTWDAFLVRIQPGGRDVGYATYLGGSNDDRAFGLYVDLVGNAYVAGETASGDFPTTPNAIQPRYGGGDWDAFLAKVTPGGSAFAYATYIGAAGDDRGFAVSADAAGSAVIVGATTSSTNLPIRQPVQAYHAGGTWDGFAVKLGPDGRDLRYGTYLGGTRSDELFDVAFDGSRTAHIVGTTASADFNTRNPLQAVFAGGDTDAFVGRLLADRQPAPELRLVPGGGQPGGPAYDFMMSTYEITNGEFARFLNDAQANTNNERGACMYFDAEGNVWMNPAMRRERDELFVVQNSRIVYYPGYPPGNRYSVTPRLPATGGTYADHPVVNVSWYGAVKYCNWLTLDTGRGAAQRCYREGTNTWQWAPASSLPANWSNGVFTATERQNWLAYKGFRLPMDNCSTPPEWSASDFRVSNRDYARFLNDAEEHRSDLRGTNMFFDAVGGVWINPAMEPGVHELFILQRSRLRYDPTAPVGQRYTVAAERPPAGADSYADYPVDGVTCFGAAKYCNWLTLDRGLPADECCYREGTNGWEWAPSTVSDRSWSDGTYTEQEEAAWRALRGVRMPYDTCSTSDAWARMAMDSFAPTGNWANAYNEFYKAAAWSGTTNTAYGFGRPAVGPEDCNYLDSGSQAAHDTSPVGFYNGSNRTQNAYLTRPNANRYGIYDLSGNVDEWLTDPGKGTSLGDRASYGGSWLFALPRLNERFYVHPHFTDRFRGFRIVTTDTTSRMYVLRIPYMVCLCRRGVGPGCAGIERAAAERPAEEVPAEPEVPEGNPLTVTDRPREIGGVTPAPGPAPTPTPTPAPTPTPPGPVPVPPASPSGL